MQWIVSLKETAHDIKPLLRLMLKNKIAVLAVFVTSTLASVFEGLSVVLMIPLLEGLKGQNVSSMPFPLKSISHIFLNTADKVYIHSGTKSFNGVKKEIRDFLIPMSSLSKMIWPKSLRWQ